MQRYCWPGYQMQLLGELQRQQSNAQFCDTLLQTEGISVPTHSCILAALSPYLSQKLSASPPPPLGQKRELCLRALKAQTLLKLVGLLYSGEVDVKGSIELNDVLSAARQFGITDLVKGQENRREEGEPQKNCLGSRREMEEADKERNESRNMQDAHVQAEMAGRSGTDSLIEKRSCLSTGSQTVNACEKAVDRSFTPRGQANHSSPVAQSLDGLITLQSHSITLDKCVGSTSCPNISSEHSGARIDGESTLDPSFDCVTNPTPTSALPSNVMTVPIFLNDDTNSRTPQEDGAYLQSRELGNIIQGLVKEVTEPRDEETSGQTADENGKSTERMQAHANVGMKNLAKMKRMHRMVKTATTPISVKLRRNKGEVWEVVHLQDADETSSVLPSLKKAGSNHKRPQTDLTNSEPTPSFVQPGQIHQPENPILQPAPTNSPEPPPHTNTHSDSQLISSDGFPPNQNDSLESVPLPQPPGPAEDCDEQMEKLLEDIMIGLNILPDLEMDCNKFAICQDERPQSLMHAAVSAAECVSDQDFRTQVGHSSTDTDHDQHSCSRISSVQPVAVLIQQQPFPQYNSSVTSMGERDGMSHEGMLLSKSLHCPYPKGPSWQKQLTTVTYYPADQESSSQHIQNILELLPLINENEVLSSQSLTCMDDLRLPRCLSPLEASTSSAKRQPTHNSSMNQSNTTQQQPSVPGRPWLEVNPRSLQFPLSAMTHRVSLSQDKTHSCSLKQSQKHLELNPQSGGTEEVSCAVKDLEERGAVLAGHQHATELKSDGKKTSLKSTQSDGKDDAAAPKRRKKRLNVYPQEAGSLLAYKRAKVRDGTKDQMNLSICSVSLSSNNVLAKEREMAASTSNMPDKFIGKQNEPSTIAESRGEQTRGPGDLNTDQTQIRPRGFLDKTEETPSSPSIVSLVLKPVDHRAQVPKRGRGRPPKIKVPQTLTESSPVVTEKKGSLNVKRKVKIKSNLSNKEGENPKRCSKRIRNPSKVAAVSLKKTVSAKADNNSDVIPEEEMGAPKMPRMVSLKELQKLVKRQHSKTRKAIESRYKETNATAGDVEGEEGKTRGCRVEEFTKETDLDVAQPQSRDRIKESHVVLDVTVDKNHNTIFNKSPTEYGKSQQDETNGSTSRETKLFAHESHPVSSFDDLEGEGTKLAAESEQLLKNPKEAQKACDEEHTTQQTAIGDQILSHNETHLPQEDKMPLDDSLNSQNPEITRPLLLDAVGFSKSSGFDQEEEEVEVEVDVLVCSPDGMPQTGECENGLESMEIDPEEEEEEDVNEIDVIGDVGE